MVKDLQFLASLAKIGAVAALVFPAIGSALGTGATGAAAIGAWKKCYALNKSAPFILVAFVGAPLSQTIYGMILMGNILKSPGYGVDSMGAGILGGIAIGISAWLQGLAAAGASNALAEASETTLWRSASLKPSHYSSWSS